MPLPRGALVLLVVVLGVGLAVEQTQRRDAPTDPKARKEAIGHWLREMESHVAKLSDQDRSDIVPALCDVYWRVDDISPLARLISGIQDPKKRADAGFMLSFTLAQTGRVEAAIRFAQSLSGDPTVDPNTRERVQSPRVRALFTIFHVRCSRHDFAGAKETIRRIDDPEAASSAWCYLAGTQAKAGQYDDALASLAKVVPTSKNDEEAKEDTRKLIAECRAKGRHDPPQKPPPGEFIEGLRRVVALFGDVAAKLDDLSEAEKEANRMEGPLNKAAAWREIAWAYYRNSDLARCRQAMQKSLDSADLVPAPLAYQSTVTYVSLADLCLELGETASARRLIQKADAAHIDAGLLGGLSAFTTTPLLISVLVRAGDTDGAIATVEKLPAKEAATAWSAFATACTLEGKMDAVQQVLEKSKSERLKAVLCAGVVIGLCQPRKITIAGLGPLVRDYAFQQDPKLNPPAQFDLKEIDVPGLWNTLHIQLFLARYLAPDGTQFNERLLIYCDGQVTPFGNSLGGHGLVSAVVVDDSLYYTDSYGSGREFSQIGRVSLDGRKIRIVESAVYDITAVPGADLFVKEVNGRIQVEVGKFVAFNSWKEGRQVGWVTSEGSSLRIVDAKGAEVPNEEIERATDSAKE